MSQPEGTGSPAEPRPGPPLRSSSEFFQLDRQVLALAHSLGYRPATIFDVGASNGWWSRHAARIYPSAAFHLFEPLADAVPEYERGLSQATREIETCVLHSHALGSTRTTLEIDVFEDPSGSSLVRLPGSARRRIPVTVQTIDDLVRSGAAPIPSLLKLDVQGFEAHVLQGAARSLPQVDMVFVEAWLYRGYGPETPLLTELIPWLATFGFSLFDFGDEWRAESGELGTVNAAFVHRRLGFAAGDRTAGA